MVRNNPYQQGVASRPRKLFLPARFLALFFLLFLLGMSLSGCVTMADPEASQDYTSDPVATLDSSTSLGQTFISRRPDLNGITMWLTRVADPAKPSPAGANYLSVQLYLAPGDAKPVYATTLSIPSTGNHLPITISIPNQDNPAGQSFYIRLDNPTGTIQVDGRNGDAYPLGQAYVDSQPVDADIAFRLTYDYGFSSFLGDIAASFPSAWLVAPLIVVLWLPGWLLLEFSGLRQHYDFGEQIALAGGLSLAIIPVLMLWTTVLKLTWTRQAVYFAAGFLVAVLIARLIINAIKSRSRRSPLAATQPGEPSTAPDPKLSHATLYALALSLVFLVALAVRLVMVRDLATPAWVDSVHHALITHLILEDGAFPATYQPFLDFSPANYHPGFHSIAALFTWLSRLDLAGSLLILGQVLNAFSVFTVYLFTKSLTRSSLAGLFAAIITGFLTPMPAYYTSWGRYTELTGLLLLPVILSLARPWLEGAAARKTGWIVALGGLSAGGLFMIHYRVLAFLACLLVSYIVIHLIRRSPSSATRPGHFLLLIISTVVLASLWVIPWLVPTIRTILLPSLINRLPTSVPFFSDFSWPYLTSALGKQALVVAALGLFWGVINRQRFTYILVLWIALLFLLANLAALNLPGGGLVSNSSVEIMLFVPISILGGYLIDQLITLWKSIIPARLAYPALGIILLIVGFVSYLGARQLVPILNPVTILSRQADLPAIAWVGEHIPANETVVIDTFAWGYGLYAGNDGGYWISPLSGRRTLPPPVLYGLGPDAAQITGLAQQIVASGSDPATFWEFLHAHQLSYVYIGARGGVMSPDKLAASHLFNQLYHQNGVWIFSVKP